MIFRTLLVAVLISILSPSTARPELEIQAQVDRRSLGVGQELVLSVTVSGGFQSLPDPKVPDIEGFTVYPSGSSTSFSFVNGRVASSKTSRFVLVPKQEGTLTIPPIAVVHEGSEYTTDPIEITVSAAPQAAPSTPQPGLSAPRAGPSGAGAVLMLKASVDNKRVYVNEQVTLTLRFYRRTGLVSSRLIPPATKGFWVEELPGEKNFYAVEEGLQYAVTEIAMALFPTTDGVLSVGPATWECGVRDRVDPLSMDPFDLFRRARTRNVSIRSEGLEVTVLSLPEEGRPAEFEGAVGKFNVEAQVDRANVSVEEPLSLTVTVSGVGNVNTIGDVTISEVPGFRGYDSGGSVDLSKDKGVVQGSKSFSRVFVPSVPGEYVIPPVSFAYFDPSEGRYAVAISKPIPVKVTAGEGPSSTASSLSDRGAPVARDIRYIKTQVPSFSRFGERIYGRTSFLLLQALPPLMVILAYAYRAGRERAGANPARARSRRAKGTAGKRLAGARSLARSGVAADAWKALSNALRSYVADILDSSALGLTMEDVRSGLLGLDIDESLVRETIELLERCDATAYAPGGLQTPSPNDALDDVAKLVKKLDRARRHR